jgi:hypothetical protein
MKINMNMISIPILAILGVEKNICALNIGLQMMKAF